MFHGKVIGSAGHDVDISVYVGQEMKTPELTGDITARRQSETARQNKDMGFFNELGAISLLLHWCL